MGRIVTVVCIIVLIVAGIWWWRSYHTGSFYDGSVTRRDAAMETGTTTMENGQNLGEEAHPTPSRSDAPGTINGERVNYDRDELGTQTTPITQDPYGPNGAYGASGPYAASGPYPASGPYSRPAPYGPTSSGMVPQPHGKQRRQDPRGEESRAPELNYSPNYGPTYPAYPSPGTDSQPPNAPNGVGFAGSGKYQLYRQGEITYRVDTQTGGSCILYATMEEWRLPNVARHGCHRY